MHSQEEMAHNRSVIDTTAQFMKNGRLSSKQKLSDGLSQSNRISLRTGNKSKIISKVLPVLKAKLRAQASQTKAGTHFIALS